MPRDKLETVRQGFETFATTQEFAEEVFHPEFVWDMSTFTGWPEQQTYQGVEGRDSSSRTGSRHLMTGCSSPRSTAPPAATGWW